MQPKESGILLTIGIRIQDPLTKAGIQYLGSVIEGVDHPQVKSVLDSLLLGEKRQGSKMSKKNRSDRLGVSK